MSPAVDEEIATMLLEKHVDKYLEEAAGSKHK